MFNNTKGTHNLSNKVQTPCQASEWFCPTLLILVFPFPPTYFLLLAALLRFSSFLFIFLTYLMIPFLLQILFLLELYVTIL